jgi:hypothetical protein
MQMPRVCKTAYSLPSASMCRLKLGSEHTVRRDQRGGGWGVVCAFTVVSRGGWIQGHKGGEFGGTGGVDMGARTGRCRNRYALQIHGRTHEELAETVVSTDHRMQVIKTLKTLNPQNP